MLGQSFNLPQNVRCIAIKSGVKSNPGPSEAVVFSQVIDVGDAPWVRVLFDSIQLEGSSYLRIRSHWDGDTQILNRKAVAKGQASTVYFNGPAVTVELVAAAGTMENWVSIRKVIFGSPYPADNNMAPTSDCEDIDTGAPSNDGPARKPLTNQKDDNQKGKKQKVEKQYCDAHRACPEGTYCFQFEDEDKPICWAGDPCAKCESKKCDMLESLPPQIRCRPSEASLGFGSTPSENDVIGFWTYSLGQILFE